MQPIHIDQFAEKATLLVQTITRVGVLSILGICSLSAQQTDTLIGETHFVTEGYTQLQAGNTDEALEAFEKALEFDATELSALLGQATIYAGQQEHERAFVSYDTIIQNYPRYIDAWNGRGLAAFNLEDFDEALSSFEKAIADRPVNGFFYESLAWTRMCRGEFELAAESATTATLMYGRKGENSIYPLLIAYFAYGEISNTEAAARTLKFAQTSRPVNQWPSPVVDYLANKIDENSLLSNVMDTAQETEAHTYIGLKLKQIGQTETAEKHLSWVSQNGNPSVFEYTLARAFKMRSSVAVLER